MSFPDQPPPPPLYFPPLPYAKADMCRKNGANKDYEDLNPHALKRPRSLINPQSNTPNVPRINPPNPTLSRGTSCIFYKTRICLKFLDGNCRNGDHCTFAHGADDLREPPPNWQEIVGRKESNNSYDDQRNIQRFKLCKKYANGEECPYGENCNFLHKRVAMPSFDAEVNGPRESSAIRIGTNGLVSGNMNGPVPGGMNGPVPGGMNGPVPGPIYGPVSGPIYGSVNGPIYGPVTGPIYGPVMGIWNGTDQIAVADPVENKQIVPGADAFRVNMKPAYWKTKICSKWEITGLCPFGERCHFAHGEADLQLPGVRVKAEAMNLLSSVQATKPVFVPPTTTTDIHTVLVASTRDNVRRKKISERWKGPKKINTIYADWIDGYSPPLMSPESPES